jgi:hypothetical protein
MINSQLLRQHQLIERGGVTRGMTKLKKNGHAAKPNEWPESHRLFHITHTLFRQII